MGVLFCCAPGRAHSLEGESPLHARQGEMLAKRQLHNREVLWEGSRRQSTGLTNRNLIRLYLWIKSQSPLKSYTCTEINTVNGAGISVKVNAHYPGRSQVLRFFFLAIMAVMS